MSGPKMTAGRVFVTPHLLRLDTWPWVEQLEGQVDLELAAHPRQNQLDVDGVGDDGARQILEVAGVGPGRRGQRLAGGVTAQTQVAVHGQAPLDRCARENGFQDHFALQRASRAERAAVFRLQRCHARRVIRGDHSQLHPLHYSGLNNEHMTNLKGCTALQVSKYPKIAMGGTTQWDMALFATIAHYANGTRAILR